MRQFRQPGGEARDGTDRKVEGSRKELRSMWGSCGSLSGGLISTRGKGSGGRSPVEAGKTSPLNFTDVVERTLDSPRGSRKLISSDV